LEYSKKAYLDMAKHTEDRLKLVDKLKAKRAETVEGEIT